MFRSGLGIFVINFWSETLHSWNVKEAVIEIMTTAKTRQIFWSIYFKKGIIILYNYWQLALTSHPLFLVNSRPENFRKNWFVVLWMSCIGTFFARSDSSSSIILFSFARRFWYHTRIRSNDRPHNSATISLCICEGFWFFW